MNKPKTKFLVGIPRISMEWFVVGRLQLYHKLWERQYVDDIELYRITPQDKPNCDLPRLTIRYAEDIIWLYDRNGNEVDHIVRRDLIE